MGEKILYITVGLPRSGKTTWARQQGMPIVNPDSIRLALHGQRFQTLAEPFVWAVAMVMTRALLMSHGAVIVDATNTTRKRRDFWKSDSWKRVFVFEPFAGYEECLRRADMTNDEVIKPVIERMHEQLEPLQADELE
jgi:predicted kinase